VHRTIERIRAEFLEMPGMRLTAAQIERLCGIEQTTCRAVLEALVDAKFLRASSGTYTRVTDGNILRPRPARVGHSQRWDERRKNIA